MYHMGQDSVIVNVLAQEACAAQRNADALTTALGKAMLGVLRRALPPGTIIDLRPGGPGRHVDHLRTLKTIGGNDRGTLLFQIDQVLDVRPNLTHLELSRWECTAIPLSPTTGKPMKATAGNAKFSPDRETVRLVGSVGADHGPDEDPDLPFQRFLALDGSMQASNDQAPTKQVRRDRAKP